MTNFLFPPAPTPSLPIIGSNKRFPVRRIYCVGRNYGDHALSAMTGARAALLFPEERGQYCYAG